MKDQKPIALKALKKIKKEIEKMVIEEHKLGKDKKKFNGSRYLDAHIILHVLNRSIEDIEL